MRPVSFHTWTTVRWHHRVLVMYSPSVRTPSCRHIYMQQHATALSASKTRCIPTNTSVLVIHWFTYGCNYIFFWIPYWPRMLINILCLMLGANKNSGPVWGTASIFSCRAKDCGIILYLNQLQQSSSPSWVNQPITAYAGHICSWWISLENQRCTST